MGVVYHAHYLAYFEQGRTELLRSLGRAYREVEEEGLRLVVADAAMKFHRPAGYDDLLRVRTRLATAGGVRLRFEYEVDRPADGVLVASGHTTLAATDASGRPTRLPDDFRATVERGLAPAARGDGKNGRAGKVQGPTP